MTKKEKRITSTYLNRIKISFSDELMDVKSYWCRYAILENDRFNKSSHHHTFFELHYCLAGSADFEIENQPVHLATNHFLLLPPSTKHQIKTQSKDFEKLIFGFELQFKASHNEYTFYKTAFSSINTKTPYADTEIMRILINQILNCCYHRYENMYSGIIYSLTLLLHEISTLLIPKSTKHEGVLSIKQLKEDSYWSDKVIRHILDNISEKLTASDISNQFHISSQQLNRILMSEIHMTVSQIIAQQKLEAIYSQLEDTTLSLHEIANNLGFSNEYNLNRFFKSNSGMTPGKYRKSVVKKEP